MKTFVLVWFLLNPDTNLVEILNEAPQYHSLEACVTVAHTRVHVDPMSGVLIPGQRMDGKIIGGYMCRVYQLENYERQDGEAST